MKKLIIFDIDGTLLHSNKADSICFGKAFEAIFEQPLPSLDWSDYPHTMDTAILKATFERLELKVDDGTVESFKDHYVDLLEKGRIERPEGFMEVPGAQRLVQRLVADENYLVGIGTGGFRKPASVKLRHVGIDTLSMYMAFADGNYSREDMVNEVLKQVRAEHADIEHIVYIGDAVWDVQTTRNLGIPFIGVRLKNDHEVLLKAGAHDVISDYLDQEAFLEMADRAKVPMGN